MHFDKPGGFRWLDSWVMGSIVQLATIRFCEEFAEQGGFREKLTEVRAEARAAQDNAPTCPECGGPMKKRKAGSGRNAGKEFWGCTGYPKCRGVRPIE